MVKVIPWNTVCKKCNVKLEYFNEDIQSKEHEYYVYHNVTKKEISHYIVCPICGQHISV